MQGKCQIYNYADDNNIGFSHSDINVWKNILLSPPKQQFDGLNQITVFIAIFMSEMSCTDFYPWIWTDFKVIRYFSIHTLYVYSCSSVYIMFHISFHFVA